jgi:hypothetical protein
VRYVPSTRFISPVHLSTDDGSDNELSCELDSHADTCVAGAACLLVAHNGQKVSVQPYSSEYKPIRDVPIATVATMWCDPASGECYILVIHEALYFGDRLKTTLLNPNQLRARGLIVQDVPSEFDPSSPHSIFVPDHNLRIPLSLHGIFSGFHSVKPTWEEYERYPKVELTADIPWNPQSPEFAEVISKKIASAQRVAYDEQRTLSSLTRQIACAQLLRQSMGGAPELEDFMEKEAEDDLGSRIVGSVIVAADDYVGDGLSGRDNAVVYPLTDDSRKLFALSQDEKRSIITPEILSRRWNIGLDAAKRTLKVTTQAGVRNVLAPGASATGPFEVSKPQGTLLH